jgi:hypothetical protein
MKVKVTASNTTTIAALTGGDTLRVNAGNTSVSASIAANRIVGDRVSASGQGYQQFYLLLSKQRRMYFLR